VLPVYEVPEFVGTVPDPNMIERIDTLEGHLAILRRAFEEAKNFVRISSPYLTPKAVTFPGLPIPTLVREAVARGVMVIVFNDPKMANVADAHEKAWNMLAEAGAKMVEVSNVHAKTLCIDDKEIVEGSFNWLSAVREGKEHRNLECSFRYVGRMAPELVARAVMQMSGHASPADRVHSA
jgi:PLD-like domain